MKYRIHPQALADLDVARKAIIRQLGMHLITLEQAQRLAQEALEKTLAQAYVSDGTESFPIFCSGCGAVVVVASDVLTYKCRCSPNTTRYTFQSRKLDLKIGQGAIQDLMSANTGRQSIILS